MRRRFTKSHKQQIKRPRANEWIRAIELNVIGPNGEKLGIMPTTDALKAAHEAHLDLVEVFANSSPPTAKIMDLGKYLYKKEKKERAAKTKKPSTQEVKTVRISLRAGKHDIEIRAAQADKFLTKGHKVKVELKLRGREKASGMRDLVNAKIEEFLSMLKSEHSVEQGIKKSPSGAVIIIIPTKK